MVIAQSVDVVVWQIEIDSRSRVEVRLIGDETAMLRHLMIAFSVVLLLGCGGSGGDGFKGDRGVVSGRVTVNGQPVPEGCSVVFQSKSGPNYSAIGTVKADGQYSLIYNGNSTLPAVTYTATVLLPTDTAASGNMTTDQMTTGAADIGKAAKSKVKTKHPFSLAYTSALTSGLEFPVMKGSNKADFDLTP